MTARAERPKAHHDYDSQGQVRSFGKVKFPTTDQCPVFHRLVNFLSKRHPFLNTVSAEPLRRFLGLAEVEPVLLRFAEGQGNSTQTLFLSRRRGIFITPSLFACNFLSQVMFISGHSLEGEAKEGDAASIFSLSLEPPSRRRSGEDGGSSDSQTDLSIAIIRTVPAFNPEQDLESQLACTLMHDTEGSVADLDADAASAREEVATASVLEGFRQYLTMLQPYLNAMKDRLLQEQNRGRQGGNTLGATGVRVDVSDALTKSSMAGRFRTIERDSKLEIVVCFSLVVSRAIETIPPKY